MTVKYPHINIRLVGEDGNAFAIMGRADKALQDGGIGQVERLRFIAECMSSDYSNLLRTCMRWVTTDPFMEILCEVDPIG